MLLLLLLPLYSGALGKNSLVFSRIRLFFSSYRGGGGGVTDGDSCRKERDVKREGVLPAFLLSSVSGDLKTLITSSE